MRVRIGGFAAIIIALIVCCTWEEIDKRHASPQTYTDPVVAQNVFETCVNSLKGQEDPGGIKRSDCGDMAERLSKTTIPPSHPVEKWVPPPAKP